MLQKCDFSKWASPTFIFPKRDGSVRWVSDFRELNKVINHKIYPLPRIQPFLTECAGYAFFTKLDVSTMQYYKFASDVKCQNSCVISNPFGLYKYLSVPMGMKQSYDIAQETFEEVLGDLYYEKIYGDDVGCFSINFMDHLHSLDTILHRLQANGFTINPSKCEWAVQEMDWLGYWLITE